MPLARSAASRNAADQNPFGAVEAAKTATPDSCNCYNKSEGSWVWSKSRPAEGGKNMDIRFRKFIQGLLFVSSLGFAANAVALVVFDSQFSNAGKGGLANNEGKGLGIYYADGHQASQTFSTGLTFVDALKLTLDFGGFGNQLANNAGPNSGTLEFTFYLNKEDIGSTSYLPGDPTGRLLQFAFPALSSPSGNWDLQMIVSEGVCSGCGALQFSSDNNTLKLIQTGNGAIPEPNVLTLLALGLAGFGFSRRRR